MADLSSRSVIGKARPAAGTSSVWQIDLQLSWQKGTWTIITSPRQQTLLSDIGIGRKPGPISPKNMSSQNLRFPYLSLPNNRVTWRLFSKLRWIEAVIFGTYVLTGHACKTTDWMQWVKKEQIQPTVIDTITFTIGCHKYDMLRRNRWHWREKWQVR